MDVPALVATLAGTGLLTGTGGALLGHVLGRRMRQATITDLQTQISERLLTTMDQRLQAVQAEAADLRQQVADLRAQLEAHDRNEARLLGELSESRRERDQLAELLAAANATLAAKGQEIDRLTTLVAHGQTTAGHASE